jgi:hypothetical protein
MDYNFKSLIGPETNSLQRLSYASHTAPFSHELPDAVTRRNAKVDCPLSMDKNGGMTKFCSARSGAFIFAPLLSLAESKDSYRVAKLSPQHF